MRHPSVLFVVLAACSTPRESLDAQSPFDASTATDTLTLADAPVPDASVVDAVATDVFDVTDAPDVVRAMPECTGPLAAFSPLSTRCGQFVDNAQRTVILRGVNARVLGLFDVTFGDGRTALEPIPDFTADDAREMRAMGMNVLRLPVNWSAIEPTETGGIASAYLDRIAAVVDACAGAGVLVVIDFHQDAWSKEIGEDGAPLWAIVPAPTALLQGPLTDLAARRQSTQVLAATATFFGDSSDGMRLRRRYAEMAAAVATRFATSDTVLGYEVMNEPLATDEQILRVNSQVAAALRTADVRHLVFFEPSAARNFIDAASLARMPFAFTGAVYAPHVYTLAFGGSEAQRMTFTADSLRRSVAGARREADAWGTPLFIGEWGYDPAATRATDYLETEGDLQDEALASSAFWVWKEDSQGAWGLHDRAVDGTWTVRPAVRDALARIYPQAISGHPDHFAFDRARNAFELVFTGSATGTAPNVVYVPGTGAVNASCDGTDVPVTRDALTGTVSIDCHGAGLHTVRVTAR